MFLVVSRFVKTPGGEGGAITVRLRGIYMLMVAKLPFGEKKLLKKKKNVAKLFLNLLERYEKSLY